MALWPEEGVRVRVLEVHVYVPVCARVHICIRTMSVYISCVCVLTYALCAPVCICVHACIRMCGCVYEFLCV